MSLLVICFLIQISFTPITSIEYFCSSNSTCGCSLKSAVLTKIIGGEEVDEYTWSWAVSIRFGRSHSCGGSLISSQLVVTAAHCFTSIEEISRVTVTAGSKSLFPINQQRTISEVYIHQDYDSVIYANDIAVIRLSTPFDMNDRSLALICLPTQTLEIPMNNTNVVAIGWGTLALNSKLPSDTLQQVTLKTIPNNYSTCRLTIRNVRVQFCAGIQGGGKDTCQGDSGGPLMMFINRRWYLIGITSYGIQCALSTHAGIYTKVSVYEKELVCLLKNDTKCARKIFTVRNSVASIFERFYKLFFLFFYFLVIIYLT